MLEKTDDIYVVGEAGNGDEAEELLDELRPNIILLDLKMPDFSPSAFEKWARENYPETITLVLTSHDRDAYLANMMDAGAVGYLDKEVWAEQLIEAIRRAALQYNVPCVTTMTGAQAIVEAISARETGGPIKVRSLQELHAVSAAVR